MYRREFLSGGLAAAVGLLGTRSDAAVAPRVMVFGMSVVEHTLLRDVNVWCPGVKVPGDEDNYHRTFVVGPPELVKKLASSTTPTKGAGLGTGHNDLKPYDDDAAGLMGCIPKGTLEVGRGNADLAPTLPGHLPNLLHVAKGCEPDKSFSLGDIANVGQCVKVKLGAGVLGPTSNRSTNKGTHGIRWRFYYDGNPVRELYHLTDLLEFTSATDDILVKSPVGEGRLKSGEVLWIVNVPVIGDNDDTPEIIEHAHAWAALLDKPLSKTLEARAKDIYRRDRSSETKFKHPCRADLKRYFPPDTDPCFAVMV